MIGVPAVALAAVLGLGGPPGHPAPHAFSDTLRLSEAVAMAREANPMLRAEQLQARASAERAGQAGAWPEPRLALGFKNRPIDGFGTEEMMTMNTVEVSQMVPWPGKRGLDRVRGQGTALADSLAALEAEVNLGARVAALYFSMAAADRSLQVMEETRQLLQAFQETTTAMYGVGEAIQQDVLQAQVAVARMSGDIVVMQQDRLAAQARFNALLGRAPETAVGSLELPDVGPGLPSVDSLMRLASAGRPALAAAAARVGSATAGLAAARKEWWPDLMVAVEYGQRPRYNDMMSLMVGFSVPITGGSRQRPMQREMQAMEAMAEASARDLENETFAMLAEQRAMAERARTLAGLYRTQVLPQARASVASAQSAYRVGQADFMTLVESQMTVNRYRLEEIRLAAEYHTAAVAIRALLGERENGQ